MSELVKNYNYNEFDLKTNYHFWKGYGFLEGVVYPFDYELAFLFHCATVYLYNGIKIHTFNEKIILVEKNVKIVFENCNSDINVETLYYPCIRRIYVKSYEDVESERGLNVYTLFHVLKNFLCGMTDEKFEHLEREISPYIPMDIQAEYCVWFCNYYSDTYNSHKKHLILESEKPSTGFIKKQIKKGVDKFRDEQRRKIRNINV